MKIMYVACNPIGPQEKDGDEGAAGAGEARQKLVVTTLCAVLEGLSSTVVG